MAFVCVCGSRILGRDNLKDYYRRMCSTTDLRTQPIGTAYVRRAEEEEEDELEPDGTTDDDQEEKEKDGNASIVTDGASSMPNTTMALFEVLQKLNEYERDRKEDRRALLEELKAMERRLCACISDAFSRYDPSVTVEESAVVAPVSEDEVAGDSVVAGKRKRQPPSTINSTRKALRK
ncbi:hypothetical protein BGZ68_010120 [Mortierella alpina]|nr:hypothetical protein BGZ68_010120 [Mortierella alpina]